MNRQEELWGIWWKFDEGSYNLVSRTYYIEPCWGENDILLKWIYIIFGNGADSPKIIINTRITLNPEVW